jgi:hypothetical protein
VTLPVPLVVGDRIKVGMGNLDVLAVDGARVEVEQPSGFRTSIDLTSPQTQYAKLAEPEPVWQEGDVVFIPTTGTFYQWRVVDPANPSEYAWFKFGESTPAVPQPTPRLQHLKVRDNQPV